MTAGVTSLIERSRQRLVRQRQLNALGMRIPLALAGGWCGWILFQRFALSPLLLVIPFLLFLAYLFVCLYRIKNSVAQELAATVIDEKTDSQERFLTLASLAQTPTPSSLLPVLQQQAENKGAAFHLRKDIPFSLDRRVLISVGSSTLCILAFMFLSPLLSVSPPEASLPQSTLLPSPQDIEQLKEFARTLMRKENAPEEQKAGEQLLALAEQLQDPARSPEEKRRLIEEAQQRMNVSLPQLLPFDLKLFANESKDDSGEGNQSDKPQQEGKSQAKSDQSPENKQTGQTSSEKTPESQSGSQEGKQDKQQPQPQESGGGIKFDQPQQKEGKKQERSEQNTPGEQQQAAQNQQPNNQTPGTDPNQPGGQNSEKQDPEKKGQTPNPQLSDPEKKGQGPTLSGGRGERFLQPGEQPGGFLTKDTRFVKVRVPMGNEPQGKGDTLTVNNNPAQPKTPYSNIPLKEVPPDRPQPTQPIPLEYRSILK